MDSDNSNSNSNPNQNPNANHNPNPFSVFNSQSQPQGGHQPSSAFPSAFNNPNSNPNPSTIKSHSNKTWTSNSNSNQSNRGGFGGIVNDGRGNHASGSLSTSTRPAPPVFSNKSAVFNQPQSQNQLSNGFSQSNHPFGGTGEGVGSFISGHSGREELEERLRKAKEQAGEAGTGASAFPTFGGGQHHPSFFSNQASTSSQFNAFAPSNPSTSAFQPQAQHQSQSFNAFGSTSTHQPSTFGSNSEVQDENQGSFSNPKTFNNSNGTLASAFGTPSNPVRSKSAFSTSAFGNSNSSNPIQRSSSPIPSLPPSSEVSAAPSPIAASASSSTPAAAPSAFSSFLRKPAASGFTGSKSNGFSSATEEEEEEEDEDEIRKRRFEGMEKVGERFVELKAIRTVLREKYQKSGILPDPDRAQDLSTAQSVTGTCFEMCPEFERIEREYQKEADQFEVYPNTFRIDPLLAVKIYRRPAAGREIALPEDIRPPIVLKKTLDYLFHRLLPSNPENPMFGKVQGFVWNRTRAIRQDFIVQGKGEEITIECHERIARMHIVYLHWKGGIGKGKGVGGNQNEGWSEQQELEQLRKTLRSLIEFYDDYRLSTGTSCVNESEFRSYNLLLHIQDPETLREVETLPTAIFLDPSVQSALRIRSYAQRSNNLEKRGQPKNTGSTLNFWTRFFHELKGPQVNYLLACLAENLFQSVRTGAVKALLKSYMSQHRGVNVDWLADMLETDDKEEVEELARTWKLEVNQDDGAVGINKNATLFEDKPISPPFSSSIVEAKRGSFTLQDIVDGRASGAAPLIQLSESEGSTISQDAQAQIAALRKVVAASSPSLNPQWLPELRSQGESFSLPPPVSSSSSFPPTTAVASHPPSASTFTSPTSNTNILGNPSKPSAFQSSPQPLAVPQSAFTPSTKPTTLSALPASSAFAPAFKPAAPSPLALPPKVASPSPSPAASPASNSSFRKEIGSPAEQRPSTSSSSNLQQVTSTFGRSSKSMGTISSPSTSAFFSPFQPPPQTSNPPVSTSTQASASSLLAPPPQPSSKRSRNEEEATPEASSHSQFPPQKQGRKRAVSTSRSPAMVDAAARAQEEAEAKQVAAEKEYEARKLQALAERKRSRGVLLSSVSEGLIDRLSGEYLDSQILGIGMEVFSDEKFRRTSLGVAFARWSSAMNQRLEEGRQKERLEEVKDRLRRSKIGRSVRPHSTFSSSHNSLQQRYQDQLDASLRSSLRDSVSSLRRSKSIVNEAIESDRHLFEVAHESSMKLWDFGSFHTSLCLQLAHLVEQVQPGTLSLWNVALSTAPPEGSQEEQTATRWIREKFALNPGDVIGPIQEVIDGASLQVVDASSLLVEGPSSSQLGLLVFECSPLLGHQSSQENLSALWESDFRRLLALSNSKSVRKGEFLPRLLIIFWSNDHALLALSTNPFTRRKQIFSRLGYPARLGVWADVALLELGDQDPQLSFDRTIEKLLPSIAWNSAKRSWTLEDLVEPLKSAWSELVQNVQDGMKRLSEATDPSFSHSVQVSASELAVKSMQNLVELANDLLYYLVDMSDTILESVQELEIPQVSDFRHDGGSWNVNEAFYASADSQLDANTFLDEPEFRLIQVTLSEARAAGTPFPLSTYLERLLQHSLHRLEQSWLSIREGGELDLEAHVRTLKSRIDRTMEATSNKARAIWIEQAKFTETEKEGVVKSNGTKPAKRSAREELQSSSPASKKKVKSTPSVKAKVLEEVSEFPPEGALASLQALIASSNSLLDSPSEGS